MLMFKKLTDKLQKNPKAKKLLAGTFAVVMCMTMLAPAAFAEGEGTAISASEAATQVVGFLSGDLNLATVLSVIGVGIASSLGLFVGWWAVRKIVKMLVKAFKGGKVST